MKKELCDEYLFNLQQIDPTLHDFFSEDVSFQRLSKQPNVYSEDYYEQINKNDKYYLKKLQQKETLTFYDKLLLRDIQKSIHFEEDYEIFMYMPVNLFQNILIDYVDECRGDGYFKFTTKKHVSSFMKRMKTLTPITNEIILKMKDGIKHKITLPKLVVNEMILQIQTILSEKTYLSNQPHPEWKLSVETYLVENLKRFLHFLKEDYLPYSSSICGLHQYNKGKEYYKSLISFNILSDLSPEQCHNFGMQEIKQIQKLLQGVPKDTKKIEPKQLLKEVQSVKRDIDQKSSVYFESPNTDYEIKVSTKHKQNVNAYYEPALGAKTKGVFYINPTFPWTQGHLLSLILHEGFPGHHYELHYHKEKTHFPQYMKIWNNETYSEGWANYAEQLYPYQKDGSYYGKLMDDMLRSVRLVVDTGINYYGWSYPKCFKFMKKYTNLSNKEIKKEIIRYLCIPSQALSYKVGSAILNYLLHGFFRKGYRIQQFHTFVLDQGPCYMDTLIEQSLKLK